MQRKINDPQKKHLFEKVESLINIILNTNSLKLTISLPRPSLIPIKMMSIPRKDTLICIMKQKIRF